MNENNWFIPSIVAAICWGFGYAISARLAEKYSPLTIFAFSSISYIPVMFSLICIPEIRENMNNLLKSDDRILLLIDMLLTITASFLIYYALSKGHPVEAAVVETTYPLFSFIAMFLLFGVTTISLNTVVGGLLIFVGIITISLEVKP